MKIINISNDNAIRDAVSVLTSGGLIIYPTETAYGVGVDATNSLAVDKLIEYKKIPTNKPTSVAVTSEKMAEQFVELNLVAKNFYKNFLPGPYTIISKSKNKTDSRLNSDKRTLGIRIPNHFFILSVIENFQRPVTSTSANSHGKKTPYSVQDVLDTLSEKQKSMIDLIVDGGELPKRPASTVIDTTTEELVTHRAGILDPINFSLTKKYISYNVEDSAKFGEEILDLATSSNVNLILLDGDLGAGKTHLTKGIARGLNIQQTIKSPTYSYVNEYKISKNGTNGVEKFLHYDAWRIENIEDLNSLKIENDIAKNKFVVIEWPGVIKLLKPEFFNSLNYIYVEISKVNEHERLLKAFQSNTL